MSLLEGQGGREWRTGKDIGKGQGQFRKKKKKKRKSLSCHLLLGLGG